MIKFEFIGGKSLIRGDITLEFIDPEVFEYALSLLDDGKIFENFVNSFLSEILGHTFTPVGGLHDRGIDGLEYLFNQKERKQYIFQSSIQKDCKNKLHLSLKKLNDNKIRFDKFYFITNRIFPEIDKETDHLYEQYKKPIYIYDLKWLSARVNHSEGTIRAYEVYISDHFHEFKKPGKSYIFSNLIDDPRLFVFLRQQWDESKGDLKTEEILADTLILYCLEGTDPDKNQVKTNEEIKKDISKLIKFNPSLLSDTIDKRLITLSEKPRQIKYHTKQKGYCLPYDTRLQIQERNFKDNALYKTFKTQVKHKLKKYQGKENIKLSDSFSLIEAIINKLFYQQGLEFADFVLEGENQSAIEKDLGDIISSTVDESSVGLKNREEVKSLLLVTIRDIVYNGSFEQKLFLKKLSNTYMMLFLLQCDPKLCIYFSTMASELNIYVGNSILVPALSEIFLKPINKNHCNLLKKASDLGVKLSINKTILDELVSHFRMIKNKYEVEYKDNEDIYLSDEMMVLYVEDIMIRAYFYAKLREEVTDFDEFLDKFVTPNMSNAEYELLEWLEDEFGIKFISDESLEIQINAADEKLLYKELKNLKKDDVRAQSDSKFVLTIYAIREKNNEMDSSHIFGYKTWWLTKDVRTQRAVRNVFNDKYKITCYMRPDFLLNYISLAPKKRDINDVYKEIFPSLLGVNISFHIPEEVSGTVHKYIKMHASKSPVRIKAAIRDLTDKLKTNPKLRNRKKVEHFLDKRLSELKKY
ncbi:MAG: hypothetical protein KAU46_11530 [Candidatus Aminicenantes bacterium]|nr:hypothetical protein [Candidatus Aminicenantes bacterium]